MIVLNQARYLRDKGYNVAVLTSVVDGYTADDEFESIKIYRRDFINSGKKFAKEEIIAQLEIIEAERKPELIHFHNGSYPAASKDMDAGAQNVKAIFSFLKNKDCIIVEHSHNAQLKNPAATKQLRELPWDCVICVSNFVKNKWIEFGNKAKRLEVVYNGIDLAKFKNVNAAPEMVNLKSGDERIIFFPARVISMSQGGISKQKNFELVLKACSLLAKKWNNFRLVAILNQAERKDDTEDAFRELDKLLANYSLGSKINFIPTILPDDMPKFYAGSDIVCVPSLYETFGLVYIEAMALGKVAIASNTGGPTEFIKNGQDGFLVNPEDEKDLCSVLENIFSGATNMAEISAKAKEKSRKYSLENMMSGVEKIYNSLFGGK